jgi:hypothetical protein
MSSLLHQKKSSRVIISENSSLFDEFILALIIVIEI